MKYLGSIFTIILLLFTENIYAYYSFTVNGISYEASQATDDNVCVVSVDDNSTGSLKIPSSVTYMYKTYQVTIISSNALSGCTGLTKVSIPYTVTSIGTNAFGGCTGLTSIEIPEGVTSIDGSAFKDCTRLTNIVVSKSNKVYDSRDNCNAIIETATNTLVAGCKNTIIPNSVTNIGQYAFFCLTSITIPNSITSIKPEAFYYCPDLTSIIVENGNTVYDSRNNCNAIIESTTNSLVIGFKNTIIPNSVTSIGDKAFVNCSGLTSITIPNSVTSIGEYAFRGCTALTSIEIPNSVKNIERSAFSNCKGLTSITIPYSVTSIGKSAFNSCHALNDIYVCSSMPPTIEGDAFVNSGISTKTLHIPYSSISNYKTSPQWGKFANYVEFNQPNQCSHTPTTLYICDFIGNIRRWESSRDGGSTWSNIDCTQLYYTESAPERGEVLYRALNTDGVYSDILTINYYDAVPSAIATIPANETKTVEGNITFTLNVKDDGYTYQWMHNDVAIEGATSNTYTIPSRKASDAGKYYCAVSNPINNIKSTSSNLFVNKCPQTMTFPEIETKVYGDEPFELPAKTNKGLTINYQSTNTDVATIEGNIVTIKGVGETNIIATQSGNDDYLEAAYISRKLTVKKISQTITFKELSEKTYEDIPFTLPEKTDKGLVIKYQSTNTNVATIEGNTVTIVGAGKTDIIATQEGDTYHYAAAPVSRQLAVNRQAQTMVFDAFGSIVYGSAPIILNQYTNKNFEITYTSSNTSVATVDGNKITIVKPGVTVIKATQNGTSNYLPVQTIERTLVVDKASQKIEWYELEAKCYGDEDFALPDTTDRGLTINYVSDNTSVATIDGNVVRVRELQISQLNKMVMIITTQQHL